MSGESILHRQFPCERNLSYNFGNTIPCCDWYFPFLSA
jgi:hypothetical protein